MSVPACTLDQRTEAEASRPVSRGRALLGKYGPGSIEQMLMAMLNFGIVIVSGRFLAPQGFAVFVVLMASLTLAFSLSSTLVSAPVLVLMGKRYQESRNRYLRVLEILSVVIGIPLAALCVGVSCLVEKRIGLADGVSAVVMLLAWSSYELRRKAAYAEGNVARLMRCSMTVLTGCGLGTLMLSFLGGASAAGMLLVLAASYGIGVLLFDAEKETMEDSGTISWMSVLGAHWNFSHALGAGVLFYWAASQGYFLIAAKYLGDTELGGARTAQNLAGLIAMTVLIFENHATPAAASIEHRSGSAAVRDYILRQYRLLGVPFLALVVLAAGLGFFVHRFLYRANYAAYAWLIFIFAFHQLLLGASRPYAVGLKALEKNKPIFWGHLSGALVMVFLGSWFIQHWGAAGVGAGFVCSAVVMLVLLHWSFHRAVEHPIPAT